MTGLPANSTHTESIDYHNCSTATESFDILACLFCNRLSADISSNLSHMARGHSFFVPDQEYLIHLPSFLSFLNTIVAEFHECIFCGSERRSKLAAQDHMNSKGHCRVDLEDEEWQEFWDFPDTDQGPIDGQKDGTHAAPAFARPEKDEEILLPPGKRIEHRSQARYFRRNPNRTVLPASSSHQLWQSVATASTVSETKSSTSTSESPSRQLIMRAGTSTSLIGLADLQVRALQVEEKKCMQMEARARNRYQAMVERGRNSQKHFKVCRRLECVDRSNLLVG